MLTEPIRGLVDDVAQHRATESLSSGTIVEINHVVSAAAGLYEKVRYLIDYREEHTIRRAAIERILKRHILIEKRQVDGPTILQELVESKYLPNEFATDTVMRAIDHTIERFLKLQLLSGRSRDMAKRLLSLAASEIESLLSHNEYIVDRASIDAIYKVIRPHVLLKGYSEEDIDVQVYCASRRALLSSDDATLSYALWLMFVPEWREGDADLEAISTRLPSIMQGLTRAVHHPLQWQIVPRIKNESICFRIIRELVMADPSGAGSTLTDTAKMDAFIRSFLSKKYDRENERIKSGGLRAVVYLFITKMTVALIIEAPYETFFLGGINYVPLMTNIFFHPILLFALTRRVRSLGEGNTTAIIGDMHRVLYSGEGRVIRIYARYTEFTKFFASFYVILFFGVFGAIITILQLLRFNIVGTILFLFFLALVSYFAFRIRSNARRWRVSGQESTISLVVNMFSVPVIRAGRWLSKTFSSVNIFVLIMDFLIETPFRLILNFSHQFILYLKEKADEIY